MQRKVKHMKRISMDYCHDGVIIVTQNKKERNIISQMEENISDGLN